MFLTGTRQLHTNVQSVNAEYDVDLQSCRTLQLESLHAVQHQKNSSIPHMLEHAVSFGNTVKESLKKICKWSGYYYTGSKSYYPVPNNQIKLADIPTLPTLPSVEMSVDG